MELPPLPREPSPQERVINFYDYLKNIRANEGMESITRSDMDIFEMILDDVRTNSKKYDFAQLDKLFTLIEQLASAESFVDRTDKDRALTLIQLFRDELGL
jgi:hypothetical protein